MRILKVFTLIIAACILQSCNDDFLERYPLDQLNNQIFWKTEGDLIAYNNGIYRQVGTDDVPIFMGHHASAPELGMWFLDAFSDNLTSTEPRLNYYHAVRSGRHNVASSPSSQLYGYKGWSFIRTINIGLENYNRANLPQSVIDKYIAEARLFRGVFYADKVSKFGDVPWVERELNIDSEELYTKRTPREEAMEKILADLDFACQNLPTDWGDGGAPGRVTRWAALLLKSRICLFEGTWRKYHGGSNPEKWLQEAAESARELIQNGPNSLYSTGDPDHDYNFIHRAKDFTGNSEVIYWIKYQLGVLSHNGQSYFVQYNGGASKSLVDDYLCTDGLPISVSPLYKGDNVYEDIFENRDPRLRQSILHPADQPYYFYDRTNAYTYPRIVGMVGGRTSNSGFHVIKNYDYTRFGMSNGTEVGPACVLRLGEALLNYAEAKAELGSISQADLDMSINKLRDRVGMPHLNLNAVPVDPRYVGEGVSPLIVEIRRERRVELFLEGFRYNDIRRWKQGKKLVSPVLGMRWDDNYRKKYDPTNEATVYTTLVNDVPYIDIYKGSDWDNPVFDENKHYLWPIPLSELAQNPNIGQNPGW